MPRKNSPPQLAIVGSSSARIDEHQQERQNLTTTTDSRSPELNVHIIRSNNERINNNSGPLSPLSPSTPKSPRSPFKFSLKAASYNNNSIKSGRRPSMQASEAQQQQQPQESQQEGREDENRIDLPNSPTSSFHPDSQTQIPSASPEAKRGSQATKRQGKGGFFSNYKASKSSTRVNAHNKPQVSDESMPSREHHQPEMTSKVAVSSAAEAKRNGSELKKTVTRKPVGGNAKSSDVSLALSTTDSTTSDPNPHSTMITTSTTTTTTQNNKKSKGKPFGMLGRSRSTRDKDRNKERETKGSETQSPRQQSPSERSQNGRATPTESAEPRQPQAVHMQYDQSDTLHDNNKPLKETMGGSSQRQNSADRKPTPVREGNNMMLSRDHTKGQPSMSSGNTNTFLSNLNTFGTKAADKIHKSIFSKVGRSGSTNEKDTVGDDHYVLKVLNKPLLEQTRKTRISKRLEDSRDKTEFWMPAFPWRAIDYLNYKGCEVEGLYRIPGSGPQIKMWQRKFDEEGDIDLFEQEDLYDINIIGSMLKTWFRELPDELFPKSSQDRVARECARLNITSDDVENVEVPQVLIDELSNLSPFNYYLLFAITCHLSLLLNHAEKNKMDFRNLCICFQPCMKIDALCFKFLVCDWRSCWKGCKTESAYVEQEYQLFNLEPPIGTIQGEPPLTYEGRSSLAVESIDERNVSSSGSSKPSSVSVAAEPMGGKTKNGGPLSNTHNFQNNPLSKFSQSQNVPTALALGSDVARTPRGSPGNSEMRPLSPIKPLSPMGL